MRSCWVYGGFGRRVLVNLAGSGGPKGTSWGLHVHPAQLPLPLAVCALTANTPPPPPPSFSDDRYAAMVNTGDNTILPTQGPAHQQFPPIPDFNTILEEAKDDPETQHTLRMLPHIARCVGMGRKGAVTAVPGVPGTLR